MANGKTGMPGPTSGAEARPAGKQGLAGLLPGDGNRRFLMIMFLVITLGGGSLAMMTRNLGGDVPEYTYKVLKEYPHDPKAFTQGLWIDPADGVVYESTGRYGASTIRKVELETGKILKSVGLDNRLFGEGLAFAKDRLYQLTWQEGKALVWNRELEKQQEFSYNFDGWGLCFDGEHLVMSNGSSRLSFRDPETFAEVRKLDVTRGSRFIGQLNEMEYFGGYLYANRLDTDQIVQIDPRTGKVLSVIDLAGLWPASERPQDGVLNGIAINPATQKMIVTGKYCPKMYEIEIVRKEAGGKK